MKRAFLVILAATGLLSMFAGCGEAAVDPVKANEGQGQSMELPGRAGRSETKALEGQGK